MPGATQDGSDTSGRLLLVSNRLPITIKPTPDGEFQLKGSSGGLVTGLSGLSKSTKFQWYGWPGLEIPEEDIPRLNAQLKEEHGAIPVYLDDELADRHYNGFASMCASSELSSTMLTVRRLHPLAPLPLPSRRNHLRRVRLVRLPPS